MDNFFKSADKVITNFGHNIGIGTKPRYYKKPNVGVSSLGKDYETIRTILKYTTFGGEEEFVEYLCYLFKDSIYYSKSERSYVVRFENGWKKSDLLDIDANIGEHTCTLAKFLEDRELFPTRD